MKKIGIIGIGNPLRGDDGIGIFLLEELVKEKENLPKNVELLDGGTGGMTILHDFCRFDTVFIIDAVDFKGEVGETRIFTKKEIISKKPKVRFSTHENDFLKIIQLSENLKELPENLFIFGIQPENLNFQDFLSEKIKNKKDKILKEIIKEIKNLK